MFSKKSYYIENKFTRLYSRNIIKDMLVFDQDLLEIIYSVQLFYYY